MATNDVMLLGVPDHAAFWVFTNVQRGIVFMWFLHIFLVFVVGTIKLIAGWIEHDGEEYAEGKEKDKNPPAVAESSESFDAAVVKANKVTEEDGGSKKLVKKVT